MNEAAKAAANQKTQKRTSTSFSLLVKRRKKDVNGSQDPSDSSESASEVDISSWTPQFRQLEQVFRSLNTVYTFCCTRKHFPTTYENLKSSVENLVQRSILAGGQRSLSLDHSMLTTSSVSKLCSQTRLCLTTWMKKHCL